MSETSPEPSSPLMQQADALMRRHRRTFVAGGEQSAAPVLEDVPVLTEVVDGQMMASASGGIGEGELKARINAALGANDAELARALERWIATQLPHALSQALDAVADQLKVELAARLRAELLTRPMFDQQLSGKPTK